MMTSPHPTARALRLAGWALALALALHAWAPPAQAQSLTEKEIAELHALVSDWHVATARERLEPMLAADPEAPHVRFLHARILFFEGRYPQARAELEKLVKETGGAPPALVAELLETVVATDEALRGFDELVSPDGRFLIRYQGRDRVLMPYLLDVLQKTDAALAEDFGARPPGQVVVEIYPSINYLAKVSPLTEKDIETSGTIALCKYNRLMFTSPRALVRGYGWRDTVAHEFVHYYVTWLSRNTVPIWLHEGIAKFQESRWRVPPRAPIEPPQEDLLARSLAADKLVTFQQMHPSMAKLPSQEAAALAFAEVHQVIDLLHEKKGYPGLRALLSRLREGDPMDTALRTVYGVDLNGLWTWWKREMRGRGLRTYPGLVQTSLTFKRPGEPDDAEPEPDYGTIEEKRVKDHTHLGELLRARGRMKAAFVQYQKASTLGGDGNPNIQNGAAAALVALGRHAEIPPTLDRVRSYYPDYLNTHLHLGEAYLHLERLEEAVAAFEQAVGINPFHPRPHQALAGLYERLGRAAEAEQARKSLEQLR